MNIKRRLFLSNILMVVIPIVLGLLVTSLFVYFQGKPEGPEMPRHRPDDGAMISGIIMITVIVLSVIFLNFFLTRFVFLKINHSLDTLAEGVHNIHDGNLDYKIEYQNNDEFRPICEDFNEMALKLKKSVTETKKNEESRKELIAGMSHDLRSPLTSIRTFAEALLENIAGDEEARQDYLKTIISKADEITAKVNSLFMFSKMDMGDYPYRPETINFKNFIVELVEAVQPEYASRETYINILDIPDNIIIDVDPLQFNSIFSNIIDNTDKYKQKPVAHINISCKTDEGKVGIIFEDDGPGVPKEELSKLFDIFYRSDASRSDTKKGSGLGLAIVKKAVERMNGRIYAQNVLDGGGLRIIIEFQKNEVIK